MRPSVDIETLEQILNQNYSSKSEMAKAIGITRQHLNEVFRGRGVGPNFLKGLKKEAANKGFSFERCFHPEPMQIGEKKVQAIHVVTKTGEVLASIDSREIIERKDTTVIVDQVDS